MTTLISIMTMMMMPKAFLSCSFSYFVFYFDFWMLEKLEYAFGQDKFLLII